MKIPIPSKSLRNELALLTVISGLVFLPYVTKLRYLLDEWYFVYDEVVAGPNIFHPMFSIDRPVRGYFFDAYFSLFGPWPLPYHVGEYAWRLIAGSCAVWLYKILWPDNKKLGLLSALFFILYPGYSWWVSAIEYQPHIASLALQVFSVMMTLKSVYIPRGPAKMSFALMAVLSGWASISLVEYAIGMEVFRILCVYLFISHNRLSGSALRNFFVSFRVWGWNLFIPLGVALWRVFFFENQRRATDISLQLGRFKSDPTHVFWFWLENLFHSVFSVAAEAWYRPFLNYIISIDIGEVESSAIILTIGLSVLLIFVSSRLLSPLVESGGVNTNDSSEAVFLGSVSVVFGVLPIILANRYVNLSFYSYYGLPASIAAAVLLAGLVSRFILPGKIFSLVITAIIAVAGLTHSLLALKTITLEKYLENFWWQASWRIPDLRPDTTLVTMYPDSAKVDYGLGLDELANLIYFSDPQVQLPIHYPISAVMPIDSEVNLILTTDAKKTDKYRVHKKIINYGNILILVQPNPGSCVRVVGGEDIVYSKDDPQNIRKIGAHSNMANIRLGVEGHIPPEYAFGTEPEHGWCYLYEEADLAVQALDWNHAASLGDQAMEMSLRPADPVEWFPFIQAYAMTENSEKLERIAEEIAGNEYFENQVCRVFEDPTMEFKPNLQTELLISRLFCH